MADRSVVVRLRAEVGQYVAGLKTAAKSTADFGREVQGHGKKASADIERIGTASVIAGAAITAAFAKAVFTTANFEKELSNVRAVSGASADEMKRLEDAALAAGASTKLAGVTASDAAKAEAELVKAGVSVSDVLGGALMGSLTLAAAGQLEFADAATIAAQAMNIFDLEGRDVTHIADLLAAAANKSAGDVAGFGDALKQGGLVAAQTGLTIEESVAALASFADNALIGSDAGTSLKTMLQRLTPQSAEAAELMKQLGFSAYDAQGNFIGLEGLAGELQQALGDMTVEQRNSAMATLFGSDAVRAANILYEEGAAGIGDYIEAVDDQGAAARMAAIQNDNLKGDIEALGGALESALIENGSKATGVLREITQGATDVVAGFSAMPGTLQTITVGLGGIVGAATLVGGGFVTLAPKIKASTDALNAMDSGVANFAGRNLGKLSVGLAGVGAALAAGTYLYGKATQESRQYAAQVEGLATALAPVVKGQEDLNDAVANFFEAEAAGLSDEQIGALNAFGTTIDDIQSSIAAGGDALDPLRDKVRGLGVDLKGVDLGKIGDEGGDAVDAQRALADALGISDDALFDLIDGIEDWDNAARKSAEETVDLAVANGDFEQSAVDAAVEVNTLKDGTINWVGVLDDLAPKVSEVGDNAETAGGQFGDMGAGMDDAEEAAKDLKEAIEKLLEPLDTRAAIDQFSSGINDMADHFADADDEVRDAQENMRDRQQDLLDLMNTPVAERDEGFDRRVQAAKDAIVDAQARIDEAIADSTRTLDGNSEAAINNRDMLYQLAQDAAAAIEAMANDETLSMDEVMWTRGVMIGQMEAEAERLGLNKEDVEAYTEALRDIPLGELRTTIVLDSISYLDSGDVALSGDVMPAAGRRPYAKGGLVTQYLAAGGSPWRPLGTDTVPAMLTPGEYVVNARAASRLGVGVLDQLNAGMLAPGMFSASNDYSRHHTWQPKFTVVAPSPARAAGAVAFRLRRMSLEVAG